MIMPVTYPYIVKFICISQIKNKLYFYSELELSTYIWVEVDMEVDTLV